MKDLTPLADCTKLENVLLPRRISDIAFLKKHPALKRIGNRGFGAYGEEWKKVPLAADFWKENDRLAKQVPMETQLEKFRQSLIAQGNAPEIISALFLRQGWPAFR